MHALLYRSRATRIPTDADLARIGSAAHARNLLWGVGGVLLHGPREDGTPGYVQWLEGEPETLTGLLTLIRADRRHADVEVLAEGLAPRYAGWQMRAVATLPETPEAFDAALAG